MKGAVGEWYVNRALSKLDNHYRLYHDLYVPNGKGGKTQVDHVVTSVFGIFVIETKHYRGWIFGKEDQKYWTQVIYKRKEKMFNPIWQNYGHIQAIKKYLGNDDFPHIHSIITFSKDSTLKLPDHFKSARVIQIPQLVEVIKIWQEQKISDLELNHINSMLDDLIITDKKQKKAVSKKHITNIKQSQKEELQKEKVESQKKLCPKCGGKLTLKKGKYGSFYGCGQYPKCRFTRRV